MHLRLLPLLLAGTALAAPLRASQPAILTGTVIGEGARPLAGATVEVVRISWRWR